MRVAVDHERHRIASDRLLEAARSEERIDLERLAFDRLLNRRVVQQRDELRRAQPRERRFELQRFVDRLVHELLDDRLAPRAERALAEAAAESLDAGDADAVQLARVAVEHVEAGLGENLPHLVGLSRFEIVIAEHGGHRNPERRQLACASTRASSGRP